GEASCAVAETTQIVAPAKPSIARRITIKFLSMIRQKKIVCRVWKTKLFADKACGRIKPSRSRRTAFGKLCVYPGRQKNAAGSGQDVRSAGAVMRDLRLL